VLAKRVYVRGGDLPVDDEPELVAETTPFFLRSGNNRDAAMQRAHLIKSVLYGVQNFYAFMIM